jgi:hypothetical protein
MSALPDQLHHDKQILYGALMKTMQQIDKINHY